MKNNSSFFRLVFVVCLLLSSHISFSQCKSIAKKCLPDIAPYIYTGQLNSVEMTEGESAELGITFYAGQEYRVIMCASTALGILNFKIFDKDHKSIFSNNEHKDVQQWDFKVNSTEEYTVEIVVPKSRNYKAAPIDNMGCVAILVGFKKP
jgi:hypothetical protein